MGAVELRMSLSENRFPPRIKSGAGFSGTCVKWSGWLDSNQRPPASEAGTLAGLSYTLLALRREIESLSPDRQSGRLTRCVTERDRSFAFCFAARETESRT